MKFRIDDSGDENLANSLMFLNFRIGGLLMLASWDNGMLFDVGFLTAFCFHKGQQMNSGYSC